MVASTFTSTCAHSPSPETRTHARPSPWDVTWPEPETVTTDAFEDSIRTAGLSRGPRREPKLSPVAVSPTTVTCAVCPGAGRSRVRVPPGPDALKRKTGTA